LCGDLRNDLRCVVFDEYTSVVDRNVAKMVSAALAKAVRSPQTEDSVSLPRFVAVTCHYDVMDWLEPDWVLDTADGTVSRRLLRRPDIVLQLFRCQRSLWNVFKNYHYLSASLSPACQCYAALWSGQPVAFCAMLPLQGFKNRWRVSRIVVLPDYQGIGIGSAVLEALADYYSANGKRFSITASHPSVIAHCKRSAKWQAVNVQKLNQSRRAVVSFEYQSFSPDADGAGEVQ
jgi:GNAT superfamily N-acetyltransferase